MNNMMLPLVAANAFARPEGRIAKMIQPLADRGVGQAGSFVFETFDLGAVRGTETLSVTAWGLYRASINGQRVGMVSKPATPSFLMLPERHVTLRPTRHCLSAPRRTGHAK